MFLLISKKTIFNYAFSSKDMSVTWNTGTADKLGTQQLKQYVEYLTSDLDVADSNTISEVVLCMSLSTTLSTGLNQDNVLTRLEICSLRCKAL